MEGVGTILSKLVSSIRAVKLNSRPANDGASSFYWSDARRIHSDPGADLEETAVAGRTSVVDTGRVHQQLQHLTSDIICEDEDDSVFLSSCEQSPRSPDEQFIPSDSALEFHAACVDEEFFFDWEEWQIPMEEISLRSIVSCNGCATIYNGYWHGNVQVHTRKLKQVENIFSFLREVSTLSCIRHENIQLFMGASLDFNQQRVAIVMGELKGYTLHARLHTYGHAFTNPSKTRILKQITEGMAYLHAKSIPHGLLTSQSINLHSRVCICLAPHNTTHIRNRRDIHSHHLSYLPPELLRELYVTHSRTVTSSNETHACCSCVCGRRHQRSSSNNGSDKCRPVSRATLRKRPTFEADVFAFGTVVYELTTLSHPYDSLPFECLLWRVGNGETQSLNMVKKGQFKTIISTCWDKSISLRPSFQELLISLEHNMAMCDVVGTSLTRSRSLPSIHNSE